MLNAALICCPGDTERDSLMLLLILFNESTQVMAASILLTSKPLDDRPLIKASCCTHTHQGFKLNANMRRLEFTGIHPQSEQLCHLCRCHLCAGGGAEGGDCIVVTSQAYGGPDGSFEVIVSRYRLCAQY